LDFTVIDAKRPYGLLGKFIDKLPSNLNPDSDIDLYREAYTDSGYKMWIEKVVEKFWQNEEAVKYYRLTKDIGDGITVISSDEHEAVTKAHELIMANEFVKPYFVDDDPMVELLHQVPIFFSYLDENCKALMDGIRVDHRTKTIEPFDLKTTRSVYDFEEHFIQYKYYIQAAFYLIALKSDDSPVKKYLDQGYTLLDFIFIAVENKASSSHPAIIYVTNTEDILCAQYGGKIKNRYVKGIDELINDYKYHLETDRWDLPVDLIVSKGRKPLSIFNQ
jgi:hypothetical protein